jgi:hypothetical protein
MNALHLAVYRGHDQIVQLLLDDGANINADASPENRFNHTPLYFARTEWRLLVIRVLLRNGAILSSIYSEWISRAFENQPLVAAALLGNNEGVTRILNEGNSDSHQLQEALLYAALRHRTGCQADHSRRDIVSLLFGHIVRKDKNASCADTLAWLEKVKKYYQNRKDETRVHEINAMFTLINDLLQSNEQPVVALPIPEAKNPFIILGEVSGT